MRKGKNIVYIVWLPSKRAKNLFRMDRLEMAGTPIKIDQKMHVQNW